PAPHQTGQAVFPHPAFRVPFLGSQQLEPVWLNAGLDCAFRYSVICNFRTFSGAVSPRGPSPHPLLLFTSAEQVASLRSPAGCPDQRSGTGSSLLRTPPTSAMA